MQVLFFIIHLVLGQNSNWMEEIQAFGTISYQHGYIIDYERETVQQLCAK